MEAVPKDWGQTQRPQRDRKENIIKPWMSDLEFRTYGEKKKKKDSEAQKTAPCWPGWESKPCPTVPCPHCLWGCHSHTEGGEQKDPPRGGSGCK